MFNSAQHKVLARIKKKLGIDRITVANLLPKYVRLCFIYLKARQQGISTFWQGFDFWWTYNVPNQRTLTLGHELEASNNLFVMFKRFYEQLPKEMKYQLDKSNEKKISYKKTGSENKIATAGSGDVGRSDTLQGVHATETSRYPDAKTTFVGLLQGAKYAKFLVNESTADGYNDFYSEWVDASNGVSEFEPIFLSWLDFPEYIKEARERGFISDFENELDEDKFLKSLGKDVNYNDYPDEEKILIEKHGATLDHIKWRRYMITNKCKKDIKQFHQEYPTTPEEAFISSGRPVFDMNKVNVNLNNSRKPYKVGDLIVQYDETEEYWKKVSEGKTSYLELKEHIKEVEFVENNRGFIKIWYKLDEIPGCKYRFAGGADVAEGLEQGDYNSFDVFDRYTEMTYLSWHGHLDPDLYGEEIHKIWLYLNKDLWIGVEKNNHGLTVINKLFELGVNLYYMQSFDKGYPKDTSKIGFQTTSKSKPYMINIMKEWIREDLFKDYDEDFWKECRTFVKNSQGKMQADGKDRDPSVKNFDDRVISRGIMTVVSNWLPNIVYQKEEEIVSRPYIKKKSGKPIGKSRF